MLGGSELLAQNRGGTLHFYLHDGQHSVRTLTDQAGTVTNQYTYDAFGTLLTQQGTAPNNYLYTGQQFDTLTGLYSLRARYYNPSRGAFLSRDLAGLSLRNPVELNRYIYVANNPINSFDPTGFMAMSDYGAAHKPGAENSDKEAALGRGTRDLTTRPVADFELSNARTLRDDARTIMDNLNRQHLPHNITVARGRVIAPDQFIEKEFWTINNFTQNEYATLFRNKTLPRMPTKAEFWGGGAYQPGSTVQTVAHAEDILLQELATKQYPAGTRIVAGISRDFCPRCWSGLGGTQGSIPGGQFLTFDLGDDVLLFILAWP